MSNDLWRWADPNGGQRRVRLDELRAALAEGHIAPNTPVWKSGWSSWRPASEVPELTSVSVGAANGVVLNIPPPPLAVVAVQQQYEAASSSIVPPMPGEEPAEGEPPPPPAYVPTKSVMPTLIGAVPAATPRSGAKLGPSLPTAIGLPPPPGLPNIEIGVPVEQPKAAPTENGAELTPDTEVVRRTPLSMLLDDLAGLREGRRPQNPLLLGVAGVVGLSLVILLVAGVASIASSGSSNKTSKTTPSASASTTPPPAPVASAPATPTAPTVEKASPPPETTTGPVLGDCSLAGSAKTIAPRAVIASAIEARPLGDKLALGFAATPRDAVAMSLDPTSLVVSSTVHAKPIADTRRVTPVLTNGKLAAIPDVDRKGDKLGGRRVVDATSLYDVGSADGNVVWAAHGKDAITKLFALEGDGALEALRVVPLADRKGIALAFRRGNAIHVGVARGDGTLAADGPLAKIDGLGQVGSPALAISGDHVIVAWADRPGANDEWRVRWTKMKAGGTAAEATTFAVPAGGLGGPTMSPSLAPLGGGRFLLAWAEGPVSSHQVRAITIGESGSSSGSALEISAPGVNAGQPAAVVADGGRGAVAFLVAKGKSMEVHVTPIQCPPR